jgi:arylsulfatase A-like enzyme
LPVAGHHPYATPDRGPFTVSTEIDTYRNALYYGDRSLGELVGGLRARGLADRTLFVVFGDHGEAFDQHPGNIGHSQFIYEENIRVPLAIVPGNVRVPRRIGRPATVVDIAPTILDLTGQPIPAGYEGVSLLEPAERMALFFTDYTVGWLGLRDGCWKYLYELDAKRSQLFDVCGDPGERHDVSPNQAERVTAYRDRLERWAAAQKAAIVRR